MRLRQVASLLVLAVASAGCSITTVKPYRSTVAFHEPTALRTLTVAVVGGSESEVRRAMEILIRADVFHAVTAEPGSKTDLVARLGPEKVHLYCGTSFFAPLVMYHGELIDDLELSFLRPDGTVAFTVKQAAPRETRTSFWSLPMRISRNWRKPDDVDPGNLAGEIRDWLVAHQEELLSIRPESAARP